jgi:hypothetical protein
MSTGFSFDQRKRQAAGSRHTPPPLPFIPAISTESACEAGALGFMAKFLVQTTLPHREQTGTQYLRTDGNLTLRICDVGGAGLPYGSYPRLILIWMTTEAVRTGNRELVLGSSLSSFMAQLGLQATGGHWGTIPRFRDQIQRLVGAAISTRWSLDPAGQDHSGGENLLLADRLDLWWTPKMLSTQAATKSTVTLSANFFEQLIAAPVPLDLRAVKALKKSPLALDLYVWATRRVASHARIASSYRFLASDWMLASICACVCSLPGFRAHHFSVSLPSKACLRTDWR